MNDKYLLAKSRLKEYNQEQLLNSYNKLNEQQKEDLIENILDTNFEQMQKLYNNININKKINNKIEPISYINKNKLSKEERNYYENIGSKLIENSKYAVVTMAGGQRNQTRA